MVLGRKTNCVLRVDRLRKTFGGVQALDDVTFELAPAAITALVGPNGAGKTTVFNVITNFLRPDGGQVYLNGANITGFSPHAAAALGLGRTFQDVRIFAQMTALENLMVAAPRQSGEDLFVALSLPWRVYRQERELRAQAVRWLEFIRLTELADEMAENLSYGQQKLLSIARVLSLGANVLLLDEPMSGLDPQILTRSVDLLRDLSREQGKTICLIEHNIDIVKELADRIVFLDHGRVLADGAPDAIFADKQLSSLYFGT